MIRGMTTETHRVEADDGTTLHVESTGSGSAILFIHEFAGDHRSWEPQVRALSRRHRCITYAARGYPPSGIPEDVAAYSQRHAVADAVSVLDGLRVEQAHLVGLSMGGFCALHLTVEHPARVLSTVIGGVGYGSMPGSNEAFRDECEAIAVAFESEGAEKVADRYSVGPARVQFENKDPRGHAEFATMLGQHSDIGSAATMRGFQKERPSIYDYQQEMREISTPFLITVGDEDEGALEPSLMMKRQIPTSGLIVYPQTGHTINLEEPDAFNADVSQFIAMAEAGAWRRRDPRSLRKSTTGMAD